MIIQKDVFSDAWCDFIFESRNKAYGAYELRKRYPDNVGIAFLITVAVFTLALTAPTIYRYFKSEIAMPDLFREKEIVELTQLQLPEEEIKVPELPPQHQEPLRNIVANLPPTIVSRQDVQDDIIATDDILANALPGAITQPGDDDGIDPGLTAAMTVTGIPAAEDNSTFRIVEQMPEYIGGEEAMLAFINSKIKYPRQAVEIGAEGTAYVTFIVNKQGEVVNANVVRGFDRLCDKEALRVIQSMPLWKPGKQNGKPVNVEFTLPVRFRLQ